MQGSADFPGHQPDARQPFTIGLGAATSIGLAPRWVQYSGVSVTACAVALVLVDFATMAVHGDQAVTMDRERLAFHVGLDHAAQLDPYLDELQQLGFLVIHEDGDFAISLHPPAGYTGPRNLTEADIRFAAEQREAGE